MRAFENSFDCLSTSTQVDLALTLLEASRFSTIGWKRFAISQSELVACGLEDPYLESCVGRSRRLLARLDGKVVKAVSGPQRPDHDRPTCILDKRMHSAAGQEIIQRSLDYIQTEAMAAAKATLEQWLPVGQPSPMEDVVLVRKHILLGRILRYMGKFNESLASLEIARKTTERHGAAFFDEDLRDLVCELSDTLRELDDPVSAETQVRTELTRRQRSYGAAPGKSSLQLSLAEALFAQDRLNEAAALCLEVKSRGKLLKFENLRLQIVLAKIRHVESDFEEASIYWNQALRAAEKYPMTNGRLTRVIILSARDALIQLGYGDLVHNSTKAAENLDKLAAADSVQHWIAGTRQWLKVLTVRRSHL